MSLRLGFGSRWFYISGMLTAILLWLTMSYASLLLGILLSPFLIIVGAYLAMVKAKAENDKWYLVGNSLFAYGIAAAFINVILFLAFSGPVIWDLAYSYNGYASAIGTLVLLSGAFAVVTVFAYFILGWVAALICRYLKKK